MKFLLTVCVFLLTVSSAVVDITVTGTEGRGVDITCPYPGGYEKSTKYFYKGVYRDSDIILRSDGTKTFPRFSLKDNHQTRSFTVTISDLRMDDAGPYSCRAGWGEHKVIQLNVIRAPEKKRPVQISTSTTRPFTTTSSDHTSTVPPTQSSSNQHEVNSHPPSEQEVKGSYVIIVTAEALVLLLIAVPLVIVAVRKKKKTKGLLSFSIVEFNPVIYEQIRDTGRHCNPEDTETTVIYSCLS